MLAIGCQDGFAKLVVGKEARNIITVRGMKISGNSQYSQWGRVMHHGCIMLDSNLTKVSDALWVKESKFESISVKSVRRRVTAITPDPNSMERFKQCLKEKNKPPAGKAWRVVRSHPASSPTFSGCGMRTTLHGSGMRIFRHNLGTMTLAAIRPKHMRQPVPARSSRSIFSDASRCRRAEQFGELRRTKEQLHWTAKEELHLVSVMISCIILPDQAR